MHAHQSFRARLFLTLQIAVMATGLGGCASLGDDGFLSMLYGAASIVANENGNAAGAAQLQSMAMTHAMAADGAITSAEAEDQVANQLLQSSSSNSASSAFVAPSALNSASRGSYAATTPTYPYASSTKLSAATHNPQQSTAIASSSNSRPRGKLLNELESGCVKLIQSHNSIGPVINTLKNYCGQKATVRYCYGASGDFPPSPQCNAGWSSSLTLSGGFEYQLSSTLRNPEVRIVGCVGEAKLRLVSGQGAQARYECN